MINGLRRSRANVTNMPTAEIRRQKKRWGGSNIRNHYRQKYTFNPLKMLGVDPSLSVDNHNKKKTPKTYVSGVRRDSEAGLTDSTLKITIGSWSDMRFISHPSLPSPSSTLTRKPSKLVSSASQWLTMATAACTANEGKERPSFVEKIRCSSITRSPEGKVYVQLQG